MEGCLIEVEFSHNRFKGIKAGDHEQSDRSDLLQDPPREQSIPGRKRMDLITLDSDGQTNGRVV